LNKGSYDLSFSYKRIELKNTLAPLQFSVLRIESGKKRREEMRRKWEFFPGGLR